MAKKKIKNKKNNKSLEKLSAESKRKEEKIEDVYTETEIYKIKVSVIIAVYNGEKFIRQCLDSILRQTLKEIEIICVNDGSTDSTLNILNEYHMKDDRLKVVDIPNGGAGAARNLGLSMACGEYVSFLDADDFFEKDMYSKTYKAAKMYDADIVIFGCDIYDQQKNTYSVEGYTFRKKYMPSNNPFSYKDIPDYILNISMGWAWDKLFKRAFVNKYKLKFLEQNIFEDTHFTTQACALANRIYYLDEVFAHYRTNISTSLSSSKGKYIDYIPLSFRSIQKGLKANGVYQDVKRSFVNRVAEALFDVFLHVSGPEREKLFYQIKNNDIDEFELSGYDVTYFFVPHIHLFIKEVSSMEYVDYISLRLTRIENNNTKLLAQKTELEDKIKNLEEQLAQKNTAKRYQLMVAKAVNGINYPFRTIKKAKTLYKNKGFKFVVKRIFKGKKIYYSDTVNICFVTDESFCMPTAVTIASIIKNSYSKFNYNIYVIGNSVFNRSIQILEGLSSNNCRVVYIEANKFVASNNYNFTSTTIHVTPTSILKFYLPILLSEIDKVLYLDGDMVIQGDLLDLYNINLGSNYVAAVKDIVSDFEWHKKEVHYGNKGYFNSGMMLMNLKKMRSDDVTSKLINYRINGKNFYMDQDALNVVFANKVEFVSPYYNFVNKFLYQRGSDWLTGFYNELVYRSEKKCYRKAEIIHFASQKKPWFDDLPHLTNLFLKYYKLTPYRGQKLYYKTPQEFDILSKINNLNEYLKTLEQFKNEIFLAMAIKDDGSVKWNLIKFPAYLNQKKKELHFRNGYAYVNDFSENSVIEKSGKSYAEIKYSGKDLVATIKSKGGENGSPGYVEFVIRPNDMPNIKIRPDAHRGLNIVVYSKKYRRVIDNFSVDTYKDETLKIDRS